MCRERATLAKKRDIGSQKRIHWLAEADEWKQFRDSPDPFIERLANRSSDLAKPNDTRWKTIVAAWVLSCERLGGFYLSRLKKILMVTVRFEPPLN